MNRPTSSTPVAWLDKAVLIHVSVLLLGSSWAFGGNIDWARQALSIWASLALPITVASFFQPNGLHSSKRRLIWLLPPLLYVALVLISACNPSFRSIAVDGNVLLAHKGAPYPLLPSSANPSASLAALWFGTGVYLSAFNLVVVVRRRTTLRFLLILIATNALALSVFGALQKLSSAGFYFGAETSPNKRYFATFIYNNHWGAFMVLCLAATLGLLFHYARNYRARDLWHSPFTLAVLAVLLIALTGPLSASRAATVMAALLLTIATAHALAKVIAARRSAGRAAWPAVALLLIFVSTSVSAAGWLSFRSLNERIVETRTLLEKNQSLLGARVELYRDTWELASRRPVFGWGLNSYDITFQLIRPRPLQASRQYESSYATAHNDWLQSLAETGFAGTILLVLTAALPLASLRSSQLRHPLVAYPLIGLGLILLYAGMEFPFSCGAFLITFWILFFTLVRHAELSAQAPR